MAARLFLIGALWVKIQANIKNAYTRIYIYIYIYIINKREAALYKQHYWISIFIWKLINKHVYSVCVQASNHRAESGSLLY